MNDECSCPSCVSTVVPAEVDRLLDELRKAFSDARAHQIAAHAAELAEIRDLADAYKSIAQEYYNKLVTLQQQVAGG